MFDVAQQIQQHTVALRILSDPDIQALIDLGNQDKLTWTWIIFPDGSLESMTHLGFIQEPWPELYNFAVSCDNDSWVLEIPIFSDRINGVPVKLTIRGWIRYDQDDWDILRSMGFVQETDEPARTCTFVVCRKD